MERDYWNKWWGKKKNCIGSVGVCRKIKWEIIDSYLPEIDDIIDVGCGNLSFWGGRNCKNYVGVDVSEVTIEKNKLRRPDWRFIHSNGATYIPNLKSPVVFCLDVLFHIMDKNTLTGILENLCRYSTDWIFIHTWKVNRLRGTTTDSIFRTYHVMEDYFHIFENSNFKLIKVCDTYDKGALYIFRKIVRGG